MLKIKKGFSLIEMMVVIAIVAVLVAIVIPVVGNSTVKAAAATNAANLRNIEGTLSNMRLTDPKVFENWLKDVAGNLSPEDSGWLNIFVGQDNIDAAIADIGKTTAENGVLKLTDEVEIRNVPTSEEVKGTDKYTNVEKGIEMTVMVSNESIKAYYGNKGVDYFADIAEDGTYDGDTDYKDLANPNRDKDYADSGAIAQGTCLVNGHQYDEEFGQCTVCGAKKPSACECCKTKAYTESALMWGDCSHCGHAKGAHVVSGGNLTGCGCSGYKRSGILNSACKNCGCEESAHTNKVCANKDNWVR